MSRTRTPFAHKGRAGLSQNTSQRRSAEEFDLPVPFSLSPLPWEETALEPIVSARTVAYRHDVQQKGYVDALNASAAGTAFADMTLEEIVMVTAVVSKDSELALASSAGQLWNLEFFWRSLAPNAGPPSGPLALAVALDFGDVDAVVAALIETGKSQSEGGWAWLISRDGVLSVIGTENARSPMERGVTCLLAIDVWEHPYYLGYRAAPLSSLVAALGKIINWDFAAANFAKADRPVQAVTA